MSVPPSLGLGPQTVSASFAGDAYYRPSSDSESVIVFAFPSSVSASARRSTWLASAMVVSLDAREDGAMFYSCRDE